MNNENLGSKLKFDVGTTLDLLRLEVLSYTGELNLGGMEQMTKFKLYFDREEYTFMIEGKKPIIKKYMVMSDMEVAGAYARLAGALNNRFALIGLRVSVVGGGLKCIG